MRAIDVLLSHNLKRTSCREGIIEVMMSARHALSEDEIRQRIPGNYDRTTFYRSFKTLEEHKIVHKIVVDNLIVKYALANSITNKKEHAHFFCNGCHTVKCLESVAVQPVELPDGYAGIETDVMIKGVCANCNNNSV
jgi:Fur family transcriptional regulator, ferric uptake regulator